MAEVQQQQELRDVLQAAQTALEEGRPQEAIAACQHVLRHFPDAITALRLLGEACLEAGRSDEAARAFDKALSIDPHNVLARVGLGVIAEDRGEDERAIGQFRLAWEIEPSLPQLRGELVRLYRKRYGAGGRLRLTRVALANLHRRNDELLRAISQLRQLHQEDPNRPEIILGLAEALWRHDEDEDAGFLCQTLLAERPRTARALLILASIQGDNGTVAEQGVDELLAIARGFDPDLTLTGELINLRPSETLLAFASDVPTVPAFDPASTPIGGSDELLSQGVAGQATPMTRWEDIASGLTTETSSIRSATNLGVVNGVPTAAAAAGNDDVDELFAAIDRELAIANEHGTGTLPEIPPLDPAEALEPAGADWQDPEEDTMMPSPDEPTAVERLTANWDNIDNELAAARPTDDAPLGMTGMLSALGDLEEDLVPFDVDRASEEEEETISFDPSKFSLPPLDGEEDDDLASELETTELEDEIAPFSLESAGVRRKTSGLTFADLVGKQESAPSSAAGQQDAPDAEQEAVTAAASIFATRELSSLPEDQLLELHASMPDTNTLADQPVLVPDTSPIAEPMRLSGAGEEEDTVIDAPVEEQPVVLVEAEDALMVADQPVTVAATESTEDTVTDEGARTSSSTADLDKLLSTNAPRMVAPPPTDNYPVDATRPLLADEALLLGIAATPAEEDRLVSKLPVAPAEEEGPGMDKLFNRLRHRKQERIQTGDLLVNRRLQSAGTPGADTGEIAGPIGPPKKQQRRLGGANEAVGQPTEVQEAVAALASDVADDAELPSWALTAPEGDEVPPAGDTADFMAAIAPEGTTGEALLPVDADDDSTVDDTWLTALVDDEMPVSSDWELEPSATSLDAATPAAYDAAEATEAGPSFAALLGDDSVVSGPSNQPRADAPTWEYSLPEASFDDMPEQPAPPSSPWAVTSGGDAMPHWGDEAVDAPLVAAVPINGHHKEPQDSVVMRVRTPSTPGGSRPLTPATVKPARPVPRQTEQLATLNSMVEAQPDNHFARLTLAVAYVSARQPDQALTEYRRLIKDSEELLPEVVERLKEMIADGEAPSRTHRVLGDAYMKLGQFDLAMAEFQRALNSRPRVAK